MLRQRIAARLIGLPVVRRLGLPPFEQPGTYDYHCTYHAQDMRGTVIVVER
jgi:hypothetical protein